MKKNIINWIFSCLLISCNSSDSEIFDKYLQDNHKLQIDTTSQYIIIDYFCPSCIKWYLKDDSLLNLSNTIIISGLSPLSFKKYENINFDEKLKFRSLPYYIQGHYILEFKNGNVSQKPLIPENL